MSKRSKGSPCTPANLPEEIMSEILLLLPARSVLRFGTVCRSWATLLSSPGFRDAYAAKADVRARRMDKFVFFAPWPNRSTSMVAYSFTRGTGTACVSDPLLTMERVCADFLCLSSKPCHGAMLLSDTRSGTYWVCNPSTGECIPLPKQSRSLQESSAGLVYDDRTKERKVVHLFLNEIDIRCEIYTLCDPSRRWRPAKKDLKLVGPRNMIKFGEALLTEELVTKAPPVFANGCLHWLAYSNRSDPAGRDALLCFSVATETFTVLNAPASLHVAEYMELDEDLPAVPLHLAELEGSLSMVHDLRRRGQGRSWLDVWMLKDHAASEWSMDYRIDVTPLLARGVHYSPRFITLLGCSSGGGGGLDKKNILIATSQHQVHAYDPDTAAVQLVLSIPEAAIGVRPKEAQSALWLGLYEDSLAQIGCESHQEKQVLSALTEILAGLPIKSIAQSMLVCRQWRYLIESESFVLAHMSLERPTRILMANNGQGRHAFFHFAPVKDWLQAAGPALAETLVSDKMVCSKPCHGLNLVSTSNDDFICNISTGVIQCLGRRGKSHFSSHGNPSGHAFSVGRSIGFGFDPSTGEHIAVEIGYISGTLACMIKTSSLKQWCCIGKPTRPVTGMPPAHVDGTLYWMSEPAHEEDRAVVTFDISTRVFGILPCEPCSNNDAFLVELNKILSLVLVDARAQEMDVWLMHKHSSSWIEAYKIRLDEQLDYSLKMGQVVMPVGMDGYDGRILLNTGRALGYYDTKTGALETVYSLDKLKLPQSTLAFPVLCEDSMMRIQEDGIPRRVTPSVHHEGYKRCDHPEHGEAMPGGGRLLNLKCEGGACPNFGLIYRSCCRRLLCEICQRRCLQHSPTDMIRRDPYMLPAYLLNKPISWDTALPFNHPSVPGPEYCYYNSIKNDDVGRHIFISLDNYMRDRSLCRRLECGYRMEGQIVKETWVRRYLKL